MPKSVAYKKTDPQLLTISPLSLSNLRITAGGTTKGCVGVQPQRKERLNNLVIETVTDHCQSDHHRQVLVPLLWLRARENNVLAKTT